MNLLTTLNILQDRDWVLVHTSHNCCIYNCADQHLITPLKSVGRVPAGTLDIMFRPAYKLKGMACQATGQGSMLLLPVIPVILEKQGSQSWGRIEQKGLLMIASGNTREAVAKKLSLQLTEFTTYLGAQSPEQLAFPDNFVFDFHHDLTQVRELFQQFRVNSLAEQANIPQELFNQFITNKQYPSTQQAQHIESLIQQFGRELLNFSLL